MSNFTSSNFGILLFYPATQNPSTLVAGAYVTNSFGGYYFDAVYGEAVAAWTFTNYGTIKATGTASSGVALKAGGTLTNATGAQLTGVVNGVYISGNAGTVTNGGTITSTGTSGTAILLAAGGSVSNAQSAVISGYAGIRLSGGTDTVTNLGTIEGTGNRVFADGITANGSAVVGISNGQGGLISGGYDGIDLVHIAGTVVNYGTIEGAGLFAQGAGVSIYPTAGGVSVTNAADGLISGVSNGILLQGTAGGTISNFGTIEGTGSGGEGNRFGIELVGGVNGVISNAAGALITGAYEGVVLFGDEVTLNNSGTILGTAGIAAVEVGASSVAIVTNGSSGRIAGDNTGVDLNAFGDVGDTLINLGTITGSGRAGVYVNGSDGGIGVVINGASNATSALISGLDDGVFIHFSGGAVTNYGTIGGADGVNMRDGGTVVNDSGGFITGILTGIYIANASGTVTNFGTVTATNGAGTGIKLTAGTVTNRGTVVGGTNGTGIYLYRGNVTNYGTIIASGPSAEAVYVRYGTFFNQGVVEDAAFGIEISPGMSATNGGMVNVAGTVIGATGIAVVPSVLAGQTIRVSGTVIGTAGTAVSLGGGTNRLIVDAGAAFTGMLDGGGGSSVLEISGGGSGGSGGAVGAGGATAYVSLGSVVNFSALQVDASATVGAAGVLSIPTLVNQGQVNIGSGDQFAFASVSGSSTGVIDLRTGGTVTFSGVVANQTLYFHPPGGTALIEEANAFGATITDFAAGDTIDLTGFVASGKSFANNALVLTDTLSNHVTLAIVGSFSTSSFVLASDGGTGTDITTVACFCRGTRVLTEAGEVAVEDLAIGDRVVTLSSEARPIKWIGRRAYDGRFAATNHAVLPIRIEAGALGDGVPARDLFVSPEHALYLDDALVPAGLLANGATIRQVERVERVEYFHIELDSHDVILAEGAPAETFVDCDNRLMFQNGAEYAALYPDDDRPAWMFCAPRVEAGSPALAAVRAALLARAEELGHRLELDPDPDLHLIVDGGTIWPDRIAGERYRFRIPAGARAVSLASRSAVPAEIEAGSRDHRRLGVPVERIVLFDRERSIEAAHDDAALSEGFHANEELQRWTNGRARLPESWLRSFPGGATLDVHLVPSGLGYRLPPGAGAAAAA